MKLWTNIALASALVGLMACGSEKPKPDPLPSPEEQAATFEANVQEYLKNSPYQDTYDFMMRHTNNGELGSFNTWVIGKKPILVKAGEDKSVRMNNDTYYKLAFIMLDDGPVTLSSEEPSEDRFTSFQLMDKRNVNYRNVIQPSGKYTLYFGAKPENVEGELIQVPSAFSVVMVRVEVKDKSDSRDLVFAEKVFKGIKISGPTPAKAPKVDVLSGFSADVSAEALKRMNDGERTLKLSETTPSIGQTIGKDIPYLNLAVGTKVGWGAPERAHSAYEIIRTDVKGSVLDGNRGVFTVTTVEPPVDAFWSVTVYDTARGGFLHPNSKNRYHINNTTAVKNADGTVTFIFKRSCAAADKNCLEVPPGPFELVPRYYLPKAEILDDDWTFPAIKLQ